MMFVADLLFYFLNHPVETIGVLCVVLGLFLQRLARKRKDPRK